MVRRGVQHANPSGITSCNRLSKTVFRQFAALGTQNTLLRCLKVLALFFVWLLLVFGPPALTADSDLPSLIAEHSTWEMPAWYCEQQSVFKLSALAYSSTAVVGSIWGALYVRRRRKRKAADKQI